MNRPKFTGGNSSYGRRMFTKKINKNININNIYKKLVKLEGEILNLFRKEIGPRGPTGIGGCNQFDNSISLLNSAIAMLRAVNLKKCALNKTVKKTKWYKFWIK